MQIKLTVYNIKHDGNKFMFGMEGCDGVSNRACDDSSLDMHERLVRQKATNSVCDTNGLLAYVVLLVGMLEKWPIRVFTNYLLNVPNELDLQCLAGLLNPRILQYKEGSLFVLHNPDPCPMTI